MTNPPSVPSTARESPEMPRVNELKALLVEASNELKAHIDREYPHRTRYSSEMQKWERDMDLIRRIHACLAKPDV